MHRLLSRTIWLCLSVPPRNGGTLHAPLRLPLETVSTLHVLLTMLLLMLIHNANASSISFVFRSSASGADAASPQVSLLASGPNTSGYLGRSESFAGGGTVLVLEESGKGGGRNTNGAIYIPPYTGGAVLKLSAGTMGGSAVETVMGDSTFGASQFEAPFTLRPGTYLRHTSLKTTTQPSRFH